MKGNEQVEKQNDGTDDERFAEGPQSFAPSRWDLLAKYRLVLVRSDAREDRDRIYNALLCVVLIEIVENDVHCVCVEKVISVGEMLRTHQILRFVDCRCYGMWR